MKSFLRFVGSGGSMLRFVGSGGSILRFVGSGGSMLRFGGSTSIRTHCSVCVTAPTGPSLFLLCSSCGLCMLSVLCKEQGITVLVKLTLQLSIIKQAYNVEGESIYVYIVLCVCRAFAVRLVCRACVVHLV